jgi:uncharacterized membrane protein
MPENTKRPARHHSAGAGIVGVGVGIVYLVIGIAHDQLWSGLAGLAIMLAYVGLLIGLRRRSETAELLSAQPSDERQAQVVLRASALTGILLICVVLAGLFVSLAAESRYTTMFSSLAAVGGFTFIGATAWYSRHT